MCTEEAQIARDALNLTPKSRGLFRRLRRSKRTRKRGAVGEETVEIQSEVEEIFYYSL